MKHLALAVSACLIAGCSLFGSKPGVSDEALSAQLVAQERQSWAAWQSGDGNFFASFLSDDHVEVGSGGPAGKDAIVRFVTSNACRVQSWSIDSFTLTRLSADTALLVYRAVQNTTCGGTAVPSPAWASSLYVYRDGRWLNALYQKTPAAR